MARAALGGAAERFELNPLDSDDRRLLAQLLGEGEVQMLARLPDGRRIEAQESVLTGLWQIRSFDSGGALLDELLEVAEVPEAAFVAALEGTEKQLEVGDAPEGAMNVLPVLTEIRDRAERGDLSAPNHILNFTLLPMNEIDMRFLQETLGQGPVELISRGYGHCRVVATRLRNVWSVQYFNAMDTVILDTVEVGGVPTAARAAREDFADSVERLEQILKAYFE